MKIFPFSVLAILFLASCDPSENARPSQMPDYYALKVGKYLVYNVDSIKYYQSLIQHPDTIHYQLKDSFQTSFMDQTGQTNYRIFEYRRNTVASPWQVARVFSRTSNNNYAEETDGNINFVKMIFPVSLNATWNPDEYNSMGSANLNNSIYTQVNLPYALPGLKKFDSTVLVQLHSDSNLVLLYEHFERYAKNVGLISLRNDFTKRDSANAPDSGYKVKQILIDFGPR